MSEQSSNNLNNNRVITTIASFLIVGILTALLTINLTMAAFGSSDTGITGMLFGTITVSEVSNSFSVKNSIGEILTQVAPGDSADVDFTLENVGTADMQVRFKLFIEDRAAENKVDTSIFVPALTRAYSIRTIEGQPQEVNFEYVLYDFDGHNGATPTGIPDYWYVRRLPIIGNLDTITNDPPDNIEFSITFPGEQMDNSYKNAQLDIYLYVEVVQVANNGVQRDVGLPGYDVIWSE